MRRACVCVVGVWVRPCVRVSVRAPCAARSAVSDRGDTAQWATTSVRCLQTRILWRSVAFAISPSSSASPPRRRRRRREARATTSRVGGCVGESDSRTPENAPWNLQISRHATTASPQVTRSDPGGQRELGHDRAPFGPMDLTACDPPGADVSACDVGRGASRWRSGSASLSYRPIMGLHTLSRYTPCVCAGNRRPRDTNTCLVRSLPCGVRVRRCVRRAF